MYHKRIYESIPEGWIFSHSSGSPYTVTYIHFELLNSDDVWMEMLAIASIIAMQTDMQCN
jgi:hypothetical protein